VLNVLKQRLKLELGDERYAEYAKSIRQNIKEAKNDHTEIYDEIYADLDGRGLEELICIQERLNGSILSKFQIIKGYFGVFVVYLVGFAILVEYTVQMVAVPAMILISGLFLIKTVEFLINKYCYVDAHLLLIFKSALEKVLTEQRRKRKSEAK